MSVTLDNQKYRVIAGGDVEDIVRDVAEPAQMAVLVTRCCFLYHMSLLNVCRAEIRR
jgi:hypothetical protein